MADVHLTVTRDGKPVELFMSFGLLHELLAVVDNLANIPLMAVDDGLRHSVLNSVFAERDANGVVTEPLNLFRLNVATEDIHNVIEWVGSHLLDFQLGALERTIKVHAPHQARLEAATTLMPSGIGSKV